MKSLSAWFKEGFTPYLAVPTGLAVLAALLLATLTCYRPAALAMRDKSEEIRVQKMKLERHQRLVSQKDSLAAELGQYEERFTRQRSHDEEVSAYLKELEGILTAAGLSINEIRPIPNEPAGKLDLLAVDFTAEGEMSQLVDFLYGLALSSNLLDLRSLSILRRRTGEGRLAITAEVSKTLFIG